MKDEYLTLILKSALEYNSGMLALLAMTIGKNYNTKHINRQIQKMGKAYIDDLTSLKEKYEEKLSN